MSDEDYRHVVAINEEQRRLEQELQDALATVTRCERSLAAINRLRDVFVRAITPAKTEGK